MIARQNLKNDLLDIFSALGDFQYQYDWVITDHDLWYSENCPVEVRKRWQWTGLQMDGVELSEHLRLGYIHFVAGGVLSAVPKGTKTELVCWHTPYWAHENLFSPNYRFQTLLAQIEFLCYDGYAWIIVCEPIFSERIFRALPQIKTPKEFYSK